MRRRSRCLAVAVMAAMLLGPAMHAAGAPPGNDAFERAWARADRPVADSIANRTWMWGPEANTPVLYEDYAQSPEGRRAVQYFDKSRMEITYPGAVDDGIWYVTNGLLVVEMVEGFVQIGDVERDESPLPAEVNIAGDPGQRPTYADIDRFGLRHVPARAAGTLIDAWFDGAGVTQVARASLPELVYAAQRVTVDGLDHTIAEPFWTFMNSAGTVYDGDGFVTSGLFPNPFYATGYPITESYWSILEVGGVARSVLWQCFERRCLTYTPDNPDGWKVEAGNVGLHYLHWRQQIVLSGRFVFEHPDGYTILVAGDTDGTDYVLPGSQPPPPGQFRRLDDPQFSDPRWSPDGQHIVLVFTSGNVDAGGFLIPLMDLVVASADGASVRQITSFAEHGEQAFAPAWSPDGEWIAFQSLAGSHQRIHLVRPDGTDQRLLDPLPALEHHSQPAWSPDSSEIAYVTWDNDPAGTSHEAIWILDWMTGQSRHLYDCAASCAGLDWSPDGRSLLVAVQSYPSGASAIAMIDVSTGVRQDLVATGEHGVTGLRVPRWVEHGRYVTYIQSTASGAEVWALDPLNGRRQPIAPVSWRAYDWAP